jgi:aminopeptidase N
MKLIFNKKKAYPSSHPVEKNVSSPYEIEEYFDEVESTKAAAIIRMAEEFKDEGLVLNAITVNHI